MFLRDLIFLFFLKILGICAGVKHGGCRWPPPRGVQVGRKYFCIFTGDRRGGSPKRAGRRLWDKGGGSARPAEGRLSKFQHQAGDKRAPTFDRPPARGAASGWARARRPSVGPRAGLGATVEQVAWSWNLANRDVFCCPTPWSWGGQLQRFFRLFAEAARSWCRGGGDCVPYEWSGAGPTKGPPLRGRAPPLQQVHPPWS